MVEYFILTLTDKEWDNYLAYRADQEVVREDENGNIVIVADDLIEFDRQMREQFGAAK